jgi:hypothetical protein
MGGAGGSTVSEANVVRTPAQTLGGAGGSTVSEANVVRTPA